MSSLLCQLWQDCTGPCLGRGTHASHLPLRRKWQSCMSSTLRASGATSRTRKEKASSV